MIISDIIQEEVITESRMTWARKGTKLVRKYRCTTGPRKGRVVCSPGQCSKPIDVKKRMKFKQTKAKHGTRMARKSRRTKRTNPASKALRRIN
jgi:hypothetical protein